MLLILLFCTLPGWFVLGLLAVVLLGEIPIVAWWLDKLQQEVMR